jgi:uncharacterized membrane protein YhfC
MTESIQIQDKIATSIGFSGVSLAFLANAIIAIRHDTIGLELKFMFIFALLFIITNVVLEFSIKLYAPFPEHSTEKILEISNYCSLFGLLMTAAIIIDILANICIAAVFLAVALLLLITIQYHTKIKQKTNNT